LEWAGEYGRTASRKSAPDGGDPRSALLADCGACSMARTTSLIDTFIISAQKFQSRALADPRLIVTQRRFQRFGGVGFISDFWDRRDGRNPAELLHPPALVRRASISRSYSSWDPTAGFRAVIMTAMVDRSDAACRGIHRIGAQTQRPLAIVVIGGALSIMILTRVLQPVLNLPMPWSVETRR